MHRMMYEYLCDDKSAFSIIFPHPVALTNDTICADVFKVHLLIVRVNCLCSTQFVVEVTCIEE
jgi:hypothetical protein